MITYSGYFQYQMKGIPVELFIVYDKDFLFLLDHISSEKDFVQFYHLIFLLYILSHVNDILSQIHKALFLRWIFIYETYSLL